MPVLPCECSVEQYDALPDIQFPIIKNDSGESATIRMPKHAYMKFATDGEQTGCMLMINAWEFAGLGGKEGEEYWVLGAQFLHHYYTIYDWKDKKIGLVESHTTKLDDKTTAQEEVNAVKSGEKPMGQ